MLPQATFQQETPLALAHRQYKLEVAAADAGQGYNVIFYGDQMVERLRGTQG